MYAAGEYPTALNAARETLQSDLQYVQREVIADLWRMVANLRWRERQFIKSFLAIVHAIIAWPAVSICLLEAVFRRLRRS
jgi:hypothetical protein